MSDFCRSCFQPIRWVETENGKRMPLDPDPVPGGNVIIDREGVGQAPPVVRVLSSAGQTMIGFDAELLTYVSHFATCPNAADHRRSR